MLIARKITFHDSINPVMFYTINWLQSPFGKKPRLSYRKFAHFLRSYVEWLHWYEVVWWAFIMELLSRFTLELNAAKITDYNKKDASNKSCSELNFLQKSQWARMSISPGVELGSSKDCHVWNIKMYWNGKVDLLKGSAMPKLSNR